MDRGGTLEGSDNDWTIRDSGGLRGVVNEVQHLVFQKKLNTFSGRAVKKKLYICFNIILKPVAASSRVRWGVGYEYCNENLNMLNMI